MVVCGPRRLCDRAITLINASRSRFDGLTHGPHAASHCPRALMLRRRRKTRQGRHVHQSPAALTAAIAAAVAAACTAATTVTDAPPPPATPQSYIIDEQAADRLLRQRASTARGSRLEAISNNPADRARQRMVATAPGGRLDAATADSLLRHGMSSSTDPTPGDALALRLRGWPRCRMRRDSSRVWRG